MLSRLKDLYHYLVGTSSDKQPVDNFRPHPSWLIANQQNRANAERLALERRTASSFVSVVPFAPPVVREGTPETNFGVIPMDLSEDFDPDVWQIDEECQQRGVEEVEESAADESEEEQWPKRYVDPVSLDPMSSPVTAKNGRTYDRNMLQTLALKYPDQETIPCPETRMPIEIEALTYPSNYVIKEEMEERRKEMENRKRKRQEERARIKEAMVLARERARDLNEVREKRRCFFEGKAQPEMVTSASVYGNIFTP